MRGEVCIGTASFLSFASLLLLIFAHVGQINTSTVPRGLAMAKMNMSGYGQGLENAFFVPIEGIYTSNATAPLEQQAGLRQIYEFGLYSYCAYVDEDGKNGTCTGHQVGRRYLPYDAIIADMTNNYSIPTAAIFQNTTFPTSSYLAKSSQAAYYLVLLGSICAALALFTGINRHTIFFLFSSVLAILGSIMLLAGAAIWTVLIKKTETINDVVVGTNHTPLGIEISTGGGLFLIWAAFACLTVSVVPYMTSCCTYRG